MRAGFDPEFVVAAAEVLHERVAAHDHAGGAIALEATHRSQPRLEPAVVGLDPIVRVLLGVVERGRHELIDDGEERPGPIGHDLGRLAMGAERRREEPSRSSGVASCGDVDVDDLAVLVDRPVHVAPPSGDLHIGLIHEPAVTDRVAARSGRVNEQWCEALHPPVHGDVIDLDPAPPG